MSIRIWLGDLSSYNAGELRGEWLTLPMEPEDLQAKIGKYSDNGRGDWFIADSESDLDGLKIDEHTSPLALNTLAEDLMRVAEYDLPKVSYLLSEGFSPEDAIEKYEDVQFYPGMRLEQVAEEMVSEGLFGDVPTSLANYIDFDAIARGLRHDGYIETSEGVFLYQ